MENITNLNIDLLLPNPNQPRKKFNEDTINELSNSIKQYGILNPLLVVKKGDKYEIVAGERRYRAAKVLGLTEVPVIVKNLEDDKAKEIALIENLQRESLNPVEEAKTYQDIIKTLNITEAELGEKIGKSQSSIANKMRLLTLPQEILDAIVNKKISERHARTLLSVSDPAKRMHLLNEIVTKKLTVKELEKKLKEEKESENMNNGNFFPNFNTPVSGENGTSLNMMNQQSMGISTQPVTSFEETVMPSAPVAPATPSPMPLSNENQTVNNMPVEPLFASTPVEPVPAPAPAAPAVEPLSTPQFDIPLFNQNIEMPAPGVAPEPVIPTVSTEPVGVIPEPVNPVVEPVAAPVAPVVEPVTEAAPQMDIINPFANIEPMTAPSPVAEVAAEVAPIISEVAPVEPLFAATPVTPVETPLVEPVPTVETIAPTIVEPVPVPVLSTEPVEEPVLPTVPVAPENKLLDLENYLKEHNVPYKLYNNDTNSCVIIEL